MKAVRHFIHCEFSGTIYVLVQTDSGNPEPGQPVFAVSPNLDFVKEQQKEVEQWRDPSVYPLRIFKMITASRHDLIDHNKFMELEESDL